MRRTLLTAFTLAFVAVPTGAGAGGGCHTDLPAEPERADRVVVEHACFGPVVAAVTPGTRLTWVNDSGMEHNITGPAIGFAELPARATHAMTFDTPGIYVYACTIHPGMSGAVVVRDEPAAAPVVAPVAAREDAPKDAPEGGTAAAAGWAGAGLLTLGVGAVVVRRGRRRA